MWATKGGLGRLVGAAWQPFQPPWVGGRSSRSLPPSAPPLPSAVPTLPRRQPSRAEALSLFQTCDLALPLYPKVSWRNAMARSASPVPQNGELIATPPRGTSPWPHPACPHAPQPRPRPHAAPPCAAPHLFRSARRAPPHFSRSHCPGGHRGPYVWRDRPQAWSPFPAFRAAAVQIWSHHASTVRGRWSSLPAATGPARARPSGTTGSSWSSTATARHGGGHGRMGPSGRTTARRGKSPAAAEAAGVQRRPTGGRGRRGDGWARPTRPRGGADTPTERSRGRARVPLPASPHPPLRPRRPERGAPAQRRRRFATRPAAGVPPPRNRPPSL